MNLDEVYKTKIGESHEAGLQAVYDHALADAAQAFIGTVQVTDPQPTVEVLPPVDPVI
jgi:hypothetical protein